MKEDEIVKRKKDIMKEYFVEDRHKKLMTLPNDSAKKIVESMTPQEIHKNVNIRRFQEDYIGDYLEYLWDISPIAFWKHINASFDPKQGLLWAGDMPHFEILCRNKMPDETMRSILEFIVKYNCKYQQDWEAITCLIKAQVEVFNGRVDIEKIITTFNETEQAFLNEKINEMLKCPCQYSFY